jgi:diguanylate cyclase (GGDEF)-like protein
MGELAMSDDGLGKPAHPDHLTGLAGRYHFEQDMEKAIADAGKTGAGGFVVLIDIDDFKVINDSYGHDCGDELLMKFVEYLAQVFPEPNMLFRFGGDEFAVLMRGADAVGAEAKLEALCARMHALWDVFDMEIYTAFSAGIAAYSGDGPNAGMLLKQAELAMYDAKQSGRNKYLYFREEMNKKARRRMHTEKLLRRSMEDRFSGFEVFYQPVIGIESGAVKGAEALLRIRDGDRIVMPGDFLPLADYLELIVPIGDHVARTAARQCSKICDMGFRDFSMTLNLSGRQIARKDVVGRISKVLESEGIDPGSIAVSIREDILQEDAGRAIMVAAQMKEAGIGVVLDDFGSNFDSLGHLKNMPVDMVKTPVSFMENLGGGYAADFLNLLIRICRDEGKLVCINGVENNKHHGFCMGSGADYMQGFYMFVPGDAECLERLL